MVAIGNSFDLDKALQNQGYAYKCWFNYNKDGNTMRISETDIKALTETWSGKLAKWEAKAEQDITEYSIEGDYEWNSAYDEGKDAAKAEATKDTTNKKGKTVEGWDGDVKKSKNMNTANAAVAGVGGAFAVAGAASAIGLNIGIAMKAGNVPLGFIIAAPLVLAVGVLYECTSPNRKENEALKNLKTFMETGQANLQTASLEMEQADLEMTALATSSNENKTTTEEEIAAKQELIELAKAAYNAIVARVKGGEPLTSADKAKLNACKTQIAGLQEEINALQLSSIEFSTANSDAIEGKKSEFDTHAQNIAKEKGTTDYAATFDKGTRDGAILQATMHGLNVAAGIVTMVQAAMFAASGGPFTIWAACFTVVAAAGTAMSTHAVVEQSMIADQIGKELDVRENTEVTIENTTVDYENKLSNLVAQGDFVNEDLTALGEFEQEEVVLADVPTTDNTDTPKTPESTNPFGSNYGRKDTNDEKNPLI